MPRKKSPRLFRFKDSKSDKFWEIAPKGKTYEVRFGKWGTEGQTQSKAFDSSNAAKDAYKRVISEKLSKGYREVHTDNVEVNDSESKLGPANARENGNSSIYKCYADLPEAKPLKLIGLFRPSGGGSMNMRTKTWTFAQNLLAWRVEGGPIVEDDAIVVCRHISERRLNQLMKAIPDLGIIKFTAHRPKSSEKPKDYPQPLRFELVKLGAKCVERELAKVKSRYQELVIYNDRSFGKLTFDRRSEEFEGQDARFRKQKLFISFCATNVDELKTLIRLSKPLWKNRKQWFNNWREFIADSMFETVRNGWWIEEGELTRKKFLEHLGYPSLIRFWIEEDGEIGYELTGSSEVLFSDHNIEATGNTFCDFRNPSISG
ncbi:MAG: WGR domain-containing protein [Pirellulaceae bacterium]